MTSKFVILCSKIKQFSLSAGQMYQQYPQQAGYPAAQGQPQPAAQPQQQYGMQYPGKTVVMAHDIHVNPDNSSLQT